MIWVYMQSGPGLFTVGFYDPRGNWYTDQDFTSREDARRRVHFLNGGPPDPRNKEEESHDR